MTPKEEIVASIPVWRVSRNTLILLVTTVATSAISMLFIAFLARELGAEGFGLYVVALTFGEICGMVIDMGGGKLLTREVSADEADAPAAISALLAPKPFLALMSVAGALVTGYALGYTGLLLAGIALAVGSATMRVLAVTARAVFHAYQKMEYDVVGLVAERLVTVGCSVTAVIMGYGVLGVLIGLLVGNMVDAFVSWILVRRCFVPVFSAPDRSRVRSYTRMAFPLFVAFLFSALYLRANVVIIERVLGSTAAGWFGAAFQVLVVALYVPQMLGMAVFPVFSKLARRDMQVLGATTRKATGLMALAGMLLAMLVTLSAGWLISMLYSEHFASSTQVLRILVAGLPFTFASSVLVQVLVATNHQRAVGRAVFIAASFNVTLNLILVRTRGVNGVAYVAVVTEILLLAQYALAVVRLRAVR